MTLVLKNVRNTVEKELVRDSSSLNVNSIVILVDIVYLIKELKSGLMTAFFCEC